MTGLIRRLFSVSWIKTIFLNIYYFGLKGGIKFPILIGHNIKLSSLGSRDTFILKGDSHLFFAMLCFGLKGGPYNMGNKKGLWHIENGSKVSISGSSRFSSGSMLSVINGGVLELGDRFSANANLYLQCSKKISIGDDVLLGWNNIIMDSDGGHSIHDLSTGCIANESKDIYIGNHVWLGAGSCVLKGTIIPDGCVIASNAVASRVYDKQNSIIAGVPGKIIKENIRWDH